MGSYSDNSTPMTLDEHVKILGDDELLDFWEESQFLEDFLQENHAAATQPTHVYERVIVQELQLRFSQRI